MTGPDNFQEQLIGVHQFVDVAPVYDLLMTGVPYEDWVAYLKRLLGVRNAHPKRVLDLACGTGNVSALLAAEGYNVVGVDIAEAMIVEARRKAAAADQQIEYLVQDAAVLDLGEQRFDLCISLFDSLNYITDPKRLGMAMIRIAHHLPSGALFIFDVNTDFALKNKFFDQDNMAHPEERLMYDWDSAYDSDTRLCRVDMKFWYLGDDGVRRRFDESHLQFAYKKEELVDMLVMAGFTEIGIYQAYTMRQPTKTADRWYFVAKRK